MLAHTKAEQEHEKRALDQILINKLLRQSKQERRITEQLLQIRHEKEIMIENRIFREEQYRQARKVEHEEALELERGLFLNAQSEYRQQVRMQIEQYGEILEAERQVEHEKNLKWVRDDITVEIVNLALKVCYNTMVVVVVRLALHLIKCFLFRLASRSNTKFFMKKRMFLAKN